MLPLESVTREVKIVVPIHFQNGSETKIVAVKHSSVSTSYMAVSELTDRLSKLLADELSRADTGHYTITVTLK